MILWKRAAGLGLISWAVPLVVSFVLFPLKKANAPLFGTLMDLIVLLTGAVLLQRYFRGRPVLVREALLVGVSWFAINLILDYPLFSHGPMKMTVRSYYSERGKRSRGTFDGSAWSAPRETSSGSTSPSRKSHCKPDSKLTNPSPGHLEICLDYRRPLTAPRTSLRPIPIPARTSEISRGIMRRIMEKSPRLKSKSFPRCAWSFSATLARTLRLAQPGAG